MSKKIIKTEFAEYEVSAEGYSDEGEAVYSCSGYNEGCLSCDHLCEIGMMNRILGVGQ